MGSDPAPAPATAAATTTSVAPPAAPAAPATSFVPATPVPPLDPPRLLLFEDVHEQLRNHRGKSTVDRKGSESNGGENNGDRTMNNGDRKGSELNGGENSGTRAHHTRTARSELRSTVQLLDQFGYVCKKAAMMDTMCERVRLDGAPACCHLDDACSARCRSPVRSASSVARTCAETQEDTPPPPPHPPSTPHLPPSPLPPLSPPPSPSSPSLPPPQRYQEALDRQVQNKLTLMLDGEEVEVALPPDQHPMNVALLRCILHGLPPVDCDRLQDALSLQWCALHDLAPAYCTRLEDAVSGKWRDRYPDRFNK